MKDEHNVQMVISAGDLTEYGTDGKSFLCCRKHKEDELTPMIKKWVEPIENAGIEVLLTIGNHDTYTGHPYFYKPVFQYIKKKHNATYYPWIWMKYSGCYTYTRNNILFISLGVYPKYLKFLRKHLPKDKNYPIIIFYHYNTVDKEAYSDWWNDKEKEQFYQVIKDYNILAIINGHIHATYEKKWKNFTMLNAGGSKLIRMNMENDKFIDVNFI
jgi:Icc-related predicted phosphoesterase